ncbi:MAG: NAD(P)H-binding protein [Clostridiales bacterium]|jgi:nucleoside-diphosphate-sugar epimerase|nr:NAD(P)H-binding protein [Eubacteriales bacterium]MDH7565702.1 NAD(P)H-binding protein [Clostridiales bacterium]
MILVFGATGLVGEYVVSRLANDYDIRCFVRKGSNRINLKGYGNRIEFFTGDLDEDFEQIADCGRNVDLIISIVNIRKIPGILKIADYHHIKRAIIVSTTGKYSKFQEYSQEYLQREKDVKESNLDYTILRPTMIYGDARDKNIHQIILKLNKYRIFPVLGDGKSKFQPVYFKDVGDAIISCVNNARTIKKCYNIGGQTVISYEDMQRLIAGKLNRQVIFLKTGFPLAYVIAAVSNIVPLGYKLRMEQIHRLKEDKVFDYSEAARDFGYSPISFDEGISRELKAMGLIK